MKGRAAAGRRSCGGDRGICFLAEWIPNRLATPIAPRTCGLPYRLDYNGVRREVIADGRRLALAESPRQAAPAAVPDAFLPERYAAFTSRRGTVRRFDVAHAPWSRRRVAGRR